MKITQTTEIVPQITLTLVCLSIKSLYNTKPGGKRTGRKVLPSGDPTFRPILIGPQLSPTVNESVKGKAERHTWEGDPSALFQMVWNGQILANWKSKCQKSSRGSLCATLALGMATGGVPPSLPAAQHSFVKSSVGCMITDASNEWVLWETAFQ